jgi:hypothetical protein
MTQTPVLVAIVGILFHLLNGLAAETTSSAVPPLPRTWTSRGKPERSPAVKNAPPAATTKISKTKKTTAIYLQTATPTNTVLYNGYLYATLANVAVDGTDCSTCQSGYLDLPAGWSIAADNAETLAVLTAHTWSTAVVVTASGNSYGGKCYTQGLWNANMLSQSGTSYKPGSCSLQILITNKGAAPSPTYNPTLVPTKQPTSQPSSRPSNPSGQPTAQPSLQPFALPTSQPSRQPTTQPTISPTNQPSTQPSLQPFGHPTGQPSRQPTTQPTLQPTCQPSAKPSRCPTAQPSVQPSRQPSSQVSKFSRNFVPPISTPHPIPFFTPPFALLPLPLSQLSFPSIPSSLPTHFRNPSPYPALPYPTLPLSTRTTPLSTLIAHQTAHEAAQHAANAVPHTTTHPPAYPSAYKAANTTTNEAAFQPTF